MAGRSIISRTKIWISAVWIGVCFISAFPARADSFLDDLRDSSSRSLNDAGFSGANDLESGSLLQRAEMVYLDLVAGHGRHVPNEILARARCLALFPNINKAAYGIGGSHGAGVVTCRTAWGWSAPAFVRLVGGDVGLEVGTERADLMLVVLSQEGERALKMGSVNLGTDVRVMPGEYGDGGTADLNGIVAYQHSNHLFTGAKIVGAEIRAAPELTQVYYLNNYGYGDLVSGKQYPIQMAAVREFLSVLPGA